MPNPISAELPQALTDSWNAVRIADTAAYWALPQLDYVAAYPIAEMLPIRKGAPLDDVLRKDIVPAYLYSISRVVAAEQVDHLYPLILRMIRYGESAAALHAKEVDAWGPYLTHPDVLLLMRRRVPNYCTRVQRFGGTATIRDQHGVWKGALAHDVCAEAWMAWATLCEAMTGCTHAEAAVALLDRLLPPLETHDKPCTGLLEITRRAAP